MIIKKEVEIGGKIFSIEMGRYAKQANGGVMVRYGDTMVLVTAVASSQVIEGQRLATRVRGEQDVIAFALDKDRAYAQIFFHSQWKAYRTGELHRRKCRLCRTLPYNVEFC